MYEIKEISKTYGERKVLDIESIRIKKGETVVIAGPNGSGKSTLLKVLAGVLQSDRGRINLQCNVLYLPQHSLPFSMSVKKNILFSCEGARKEKAEKCEKILDTLKLTHLKNKNAKGLSGGECQRLALARLLVNDCEILLLDEPSSAADIEGNEVIEKAITDYKEKTGCSIIMTTHSPSQAKRIADRIIMLHEGRIIEDGTAQELLRNPSSEWGRKFMELWKIDA